MHILPELLCLFFMPRQTSDKIKGSVIVNSAKGVVN